MSTMHPDERARLVERLRTLARPAWLGMHGRQGLLDGLKSLGVYLPELMTPEGATYISRVSRIIIDEAERLEGGGCLRHPGTDDDMCCLICKAPYRAGDIGWVRPCPENAGEPCYHACSWGDLCYAQEPREQLVLHERGKVAGVRGDDGTVYTYNLTIPPDRAGRFRGVSLGQIPRRLHAYLDAARRRRDSTI